MSNSLGTITPTLVAQEALPILADKYPFINSFVTDFSSEGVLFNQTVYSRIPLIQGAQDFDTTNGYVASAGTLTDVPVTINKHRHSSVSFNDQELSSTNLNLIEQFATSLAASVGQDMMSGIAALITSGNYTTSVAITGDATRANAILQAKLNLDNNKVIDSGRVFINSATTEFELLKDTSIVQLTFGGAGIGKNGLPSIHGFDFGTYNALPTTGSLVAAAAQKAAIVVAARAPELPSELISVPINGKITNVTDPKSGFTIQVREFYDIAKGKMQVSYVWMYGCAVGSAKSLVRITR